VRWTEEDATRRDTTARDRVAAMAKAESVVERLASGHLRRTLSAMVNVALDEGLLLVSQDVMRAQRWHPPAGLRDPGP